MDEPPADLDERAIRAAMGSARVVGRRLVVVAVTPSTMDELRAMADAGAPEGTVVLADRQTAGHGRLGREWTAPPGTSLLVSILFRPPADLSLGQLPMAVGLGALDALDEALAAAGDHRRAALKWPNDVLVEGGKIAGILSEAHAAGGGAPVVVVGIGLNVSQADDDVPAGGVSLASLGLRPPGRALLAGRLLAAIDRHHARLLAGASLLADWRSRLDTIGREVEVTRVGGRGARGAGDVGGRPGGRRAWRQGDPEVGAAAQDADTIRGVAVDVSPDGGLVVRRSDGELVTVHAGDVTLAPRRAS